MSRSTQALALENPAKRWLEYKPRHAELTWYNKEESKNIPVPMPFEFLPLDDLHTIGGYNKPEESGYVSNEVRNILTDELVVRTFKGGEKYRGLYKNEQKIVMMPKGAKYGKSVYFAFKEDGQWQIGAIKLVGSSATAWIEFNQQLWKSSKKRPTDGKVIMTKGELVTSEENGNYYPPAFEYKPASDEEDTAAIELDKTLQTYLEAYLKTPKEAPDTIHSDEPMTDSFNTNDGKATPEQVADFERRKAEKTQLKSEDFPDDDQAAYNRQAVAEAFGNDEPLPEPPEDL